MKIERWKVWRCVVAAGVLTAAALPAAASCRLHTLESPLQSQMVAQERPVLRWSGDAQDVFRVQVAVVMPEARLVASYDTETPVAQWRMPEALAVGHAAVKVLVSSDCPHLDAQDLHAQGAWFFVDQRTGCALQRSAIRLTADGLGWTPVEGARSYQLRFWGAGRRADSMPELIQAVEVTQAKAALPAVATGGVVTVQPICSGRVAAPVGVTLP